MEKAMIMIMERPDAVDAEIRLQAAVPDAPDAAFHSSYSSLRTQARQ